MSDRPSQEAKLSPGAPGEPVPFGHYDLLGLIARGGMAEVYRARPQAGPRRLLAIKVMRPQLAREARFVDMFHREGKLALLLQNRSSSRPSSSASTTAGTSSRWSTSAAAT